MLLSWQGLDSLASQQCLNDLQLNVFAVGVKWSYSWPLNLSNGKHQICKSAHGQACISSSASVRAYLVCRFLPKIDESSYRTSAISCQWFWFQWQHGHRSACLLLHTLPVNIRSMAEAAMAAAAQWVQCQDNMISQLCHSLALKLARVYCIFHVLSLRGAISTNTTISSVMSILWIASV